MHILTQDPTLPLNVRHTILMNSITQVDNMFDPESEDQEEQNLIETEMDKLLAKLDQLEEVMHLKTHVDCDCFYRPRN